MEPEARIGAVVRCLIGGLRSRRRTKRGGSCWRCDRTARIHTGLTAWQRIICGRIDDGGGRCSRVDRISVCTCFISRFSIRFAVSRRILLRNDSNGRCCGDEGSEVHHIFLCIGRHAVTTKERSTPYFFLRYWSAFTWSVISPGITSSPQGRKVGTPFSTMASAYWTVVAVTVRVIFSKAHTLPFAVKNFSFFNSLYKNGLSGLIWPLLPAEHPRCFAAQELPAAIASWQKTLSRMYLCFFEKAQWLAPARIVGWLYAKGWMKPVLPKGGRYGKQGVSSACSGEESGVRTHGAFYTQRFSGPPPSSTRPPLRMCPCAWPVIWSFQLWCSQCRK